MRKKSAEKLFIFFSSIDDPTHFGVTYDDFADVVVGLVGKLGHRGFFPFIHTQIAARYYLKVRSSTDITIISEAMVVCLAVCNALLTGHEGRRKVKLP